MAATTTSSSSTAPSARRVASSQNIESAAWRWMRYSGFLLIPLAWGHVLIQDVVVGVGRIDVNYVAARFALLGWRVYDILLLSFAFAHGMNGFRQVLGDLFPSPTARRWMAWFLLAAWLVITVIGAIAIIAFHPGQ